MSLVDSKGVKHIFKTAQTAATMIMAGACMASWLQSQAADS